MLYIYIIYIDLVGMLYVNVPDRSLLDRPNMTELMQIKRIQTIQFCHDGKGPILYDIPAL